MRRCLLASASYLFFLTLPVWAQHHSSWVAGSGGGVAAHFSSSMLAGTPGHNFGGALRGNISGLSHGSFRSGNEFHRRSGGTFHSERTDRDFDHRGSHHREGFRNRYFYPYGLYSSWYVDPYSLSDYGDSRDQYQNEGDYSNGDSAQYHAAPPPPRESEDSGLHGDVQALSGKIDQLQAGLDARNQPDPAPEVTTDLVFRDRHVLEVRNYAISGGTLWVLDDQAAKKIPLAQLDLNATIKMNDDRGVEFQVPK
jgi:hypothetical protein